MLPYNGVACMMHSEVKIIIYLLNGFKRGAAAGRVG